MAAGGSAVELELGAEFAGYRLVGLAGRGGMGVVYRAENLITEQVRALKVIAPERAADPRFLERFKRESRLAARLDHPNVIPLHEAREEDGRLYLVMSFVEGSDLSSLLKQEGPLEPRRAVAIVRQVAAALDAAHEQGLVHRDVKPANVLLTAGEEGEHAYLTDFGLVKDVSSDSRLTSTGVFMGTYHYASPEQIDPSGGRPLDGRTDVYALGAVLYHALAGSVPFPRDSVQALMAAHLFLDPPDPCEVRPDLPPGFTEVVARGMAKEPDARYRTAGELGAAAEAALSSSAARSGPYAGTVRDDATAEPTETVAGPGPAGPGPAGPGPAVTQRPPSRAGGWVVGLDRLTPAGTRMMRRAGATVAAAVPLLGASFWLDSYVEFGSSGERFVAKGGVWAFLSIPLFALAIWYAAWALRGAPSADPMRRSLILTVTAGLTAAGYLIQTIAYLAAGKYEPLVGSWVSIALLLAIAGVAAAVFAALRRPGSGAVAG